ncbi:MAG: uroporphyrinogen-III synthase [Marinobacter sp.]|uniref:uroporphyrinogen-III synthase n=1 Tax=Marinobacter sp. TaxID=50741 RepID=UPI00299E74E7|nr:uroporphyrinogen-III synthase [Marinobacter sp.]MDX1633204.1 uroporphyrinogen-III synthase [Marinobacter sp.]
MVTPRPEADLAGARVLVCRPEPEAGRLAAYLEACGAEVRVLPLIERVDLPETAADRTLIQNLDLFQHVIAVSPYAAGRLLERIDTWWPQFPVGLNWYGVGASTAAVFAAAGLTPQAPPDGFTSEHLLALPGLHAPAGEKVLLARGERGRELVRDSLNRRGAVVSELILYDRRRPSWSESDLRDHLGDFDPHAIVALSGETLNNLMALGENSDHNLKQRLLVVPANRVAQQARASGFDWILTPASLADDAIATGIAEHLARPARAPRPNTSLS